jgi:nicotinamidase-related amidase
MDIAENAALHVIDVQQAWDEPVNVARGRNNPRAEANIAALLDAWQATARPVVFVRHTSLMPGSRLAAGLPGNRFQDFVEERRGRGAEAELVVEKNVNSAFIGKPDLAAWLDAAGIRQIVLAGIQTNWCVETTARMGGNLGYDVVVALDATTPSASRARKASGSPPTSWPARPRSTCTPAGSPASPAPTR